MNKNDETDKTFSSLELNEDFDFLLKSLNNIHIVQRKKSVKK